MRGWRGSKRRLEPKPLIVPLNPVPVPTLADLSELPDLDWQFLAQAEPIDGLDHLALHVAQLTHGMASLKQRVEDLERDKSDE